MLLTGSNNDGDNVAAAPKAKYVPPHMRRKMEQEQAQVQQAPRGEPRGGGWAAGGRGRDDDRAPMAVNSRAEALAGWGGGGGSGRDDRGGDRRDDRRGGGDRLAPPSDWGRGGGGGGGGGGDYGRRDDYNREPEPEREPGPNSRAARMAGAFSSRTETFGGGGGGDWGGRGGGGGGGFGRGGESEIDIFGPPPENGTSSSAGINFDKYDDIPISVTAATPDGTVPEPISEFVEADLPQFLTDNIGKFMSMLVS